MLNKVILIGNITKDVEQNTTLNGVSVCKFDLAVTRPYTQDGERITDFFECTAWRGVAESIAKYCKKGHKVAVTGSVQTRTYEDNNGIKRKVFDIAVQDIEFLTPKAETSEFGARASSSTHSSAQGRTSQNKPTLQAMDDDSDIPF